MIGKVLGAIVGSRIDRSDGDSGIKGAVLGTVGVSLLKRVLPLALLIGGGLAAKRANERRRNVSSVV
jgi:hypothetical protein